VEATWEGSTDVVARTAPEPTLPDAVAHRIRTALVDAHALLAHTLSEELTRSGIPTATPWAQTGQELVAEIGRLRVHIVLLELQLPLGLGPVEELIRSIIDAGMRVVMLTSSRDRLALARCLEAGAIGIIDKNRASFTELVAAVRAAAADDGALDWHSRTLLAELRRSEADEQKKRAPFAHLTAREREVLTLMCQGWGPSEIAAETFVSLATVRSHVRSILAKLGVHSQLAAAALAYSTGWYQA
jgi:two-component system, NarL family, nitrate/nitrite response regulator NarL